MRTTLTHVQVWRLGLTVTVAVALAAASNMPVFTQGGQAPAAPPAGDAAGAPGGRAAGPAGRAGGGGSTVSATAPRNLAGDYSAKPPVTAGSPEEEARRFILPPGYHMELVMAEPNIINPAAMAWDGNGRMYVAEMRTYMPDADGTNQHAPENVISVHESSKGDGNYDVHRIFQDKLILPRMLLPLDKGVLTNETDSNDVIRLEDTNGDGVADKRSVFYTGVGLNRDGNLEHEQSGFVWGLDNWIYSTYNAFRFRWTPSGAILRETTGPNSGQWGLSMDDDGKIWWVDAGSERGPVNFQVPIHYGSFNLTGTRAQNAGATPRPDAFDQFEPGFDVVWPAPGWGDVQGGMDRVRQPVNNLNHFTSTNGQEVIRSDRYPEDMYGDLLFNEPVGRLIRRAKIVKTEGLTQLKNAYPGSEFIVSTDPLFRPVNIKIGPDGAVYILDMYRGIIQESTWTPPGSYLRRKIEQYGMEKVIGHGRIWRLRYDGVPPTPATESSPAMPGLPGIAFDNTKPRMLDETPAQLVAHLTHTNGWWRDTAQRLLVLRQDKSVVPALQQLVRSSPSLVGRFHAMWTLEGLNALDAALVRETMKDPNPRMRVQAIRASETLYKAGNRALDADYRTMATDTDPDVVIQSMLTMKLFNISEFADTAKALGTSSAARGVKEFADLLTRPVAVAAGGRGGAALSPEMRPLMERGGQVFTELCFACHGEDARGRPLAGSVNGTLMAPSLVGSPRVNGHRDYVIKVLLNGLTGPVAGNTYSEVMIPMRTNPDEWVASVATYVRSSFGNTGGIVTPADVARVRAATASRKGPWTDVDLLSSLPRMLEVQPTWKATASHNSAAAPIALTLKPWSSNAPQAPGMWYQIELPQPVMLTEIQFDSPAAGGRGGGGGRGVGGPPAPGAAPAGPTYTSPRGYKVDVSIDGTKWTSKPVATGKSSAASTTVTFTPVRAKFLRITQTDVVESAPAWQMTNLRLFDVSAPPSR